MTASHTQSVPCQATPENRPSTTQPCIVQFSIQFNSIQMLNHPMYFSVFESSVCDLSPRGTLTDHVTEKEKRKKNGKKTVPTKDKTISIHVNNGVLRIGWSELT